MISFCLQNEKWFWRFFELLGILAIENWKYFEEILASWRSFLMLELLLTIQVMSKQLSRDKQSMSSSEASCEQVMSKERAKNEQRTRNWKLQKVNQKTSKIQQDLINKQVIDKQTLSNWWANTEQVQRNFKKWRLKTLKTVECQITSKQKRQAPNQMIGSCSAVNSHQRKH